MYRNLTNADRTSEPTLFDEMHRARARVFKDRLGWDVFVENGHETDRYDLLEQVSYLLTVDETGRSTGSLRLLPTTGDTMMRNEFAGFFSEPVDIVSPTTLECTRFCVHPIELPGRSCDPRTVSSDLLIGLCETCLRSGYDSILGLYNSHMTRVYRRIGWNPDPLAESRSERGHLIVGIWEVSNEALATMRTLAEEHGKAGARLAA
jgi:N-acyl-L-homoserine lactone synthetase